MQDHPEIVHESFYLTLEHATSGGMKRIHQLAICVTESSSWSGQRRLSLLFKTEAQRVATKTKKL